MNLNQYLVDASLMGNCGGQEQRAADNLNRIYRELDSRIYHTLVVGLEGHYDPDKYDKMMNDVWTDWRDRADELIALTDEQIHAYVDNVCATNTVILCARDICNKYTVDELELMARAVERMISEKTSGSRV